MDDLATPQNAEIELLKIRRRQAAARVRALLQQLEVAERDFEAATREVSDAVARAKRNRDASAA